MRADRARLCHCGLAALQSSARQYRFEFLGFRTVAGIAGLLLKSGLTGFIGFNFSLLRPPALHPVRAICRDA